MGDPAFRTRVCEARAALARAAADKLTATMTAAVDRLAELVASSNERIALTASRTVLEMPVKLRESEDLEARLAALEALWKSDKASQEDEDDA
jgi:hypothetical protein